MSLNRRYFSAAALQTLLLACAVGQSARADALQGTLKWSVRPWLRRLDEASAALASGSVQPLASPLHHENVRSWSDLARRWRRDLPLESATATPPARWVSVAALPWHLFRHYYLRNQAWRDGELIVTGPVQAATFTGGGKLHSGFRIERNGKSEYFTDDGRPLKRSFIRMPIPYARLTSTFGARRHPVSPFESDAGLQIRAHGGASSGKPHYAAKPADLAYTGCGADYRIFTEWTAAATMTRLAS